MTNHAHDNDSTPAWVDQVRAGAVIAVSLGTATLALIDLLYQQGHLPPTDNNQSTMIPTVTRKESQLARPDDPGHR